MVCTAEFSENLAHDCQGIVRISRSMLVIDRQLFVLAAGIALMLWLYWTAFSILVGAEFNANLLDAHAVEKPRPE